MYFILLGLITACSNYKTGVTKEELISQLSQQLEYFVSNIPQNDHVPRSYSESNGVVMAGVGDWTCGFPAGTLWYMYELTQDNKWKDAAMENTLKLEQVQYDSTTHDVGFMVYCSYGNAIRFVDNPSLKDVLVQSAKTLATRYNPTVGCIRSWDNQVWECPVIIDNMMNLELLFWATKETGDPRFRDIAISHANNTLKNHFRDDWGSYHVVDYDTVTGNVLAKQTHQGLNDASRWARGQAWALYGFTMCYRETSDDAYLKAAENIANMIIKDLPEDKIPYWDFDDPKIPDSPREASAGAIIASALYELSTYSNQYKKPYIETADAIIESFSLPAYRAEIGTNKGFILKHSVTSKPRNQEVDVALNYADYYYMEALKRKFGLEK